MPIDRFVSMIVAVIAAAGVTVLAVAVLQGAIQAAGIGLGLWAAGGVLPLAAILGLVARVWLEQRRDRRDAPGREDAC